MPPNLPIRQQVAEEIFGLTDVDWAGGYAKVPCPSGLHKDLATIYLLPANGFRGPTCYCHHTTSCKAWLHAKNTELRREIGRREWAATHKWNFKSADQRRSYSSATPVFAQTPPPLAVEQTIPYRLRQAGLLIDQPVIHLQLPPNEMTALDLEVRFLPHELIAVTPDVCLDPNFYVAGELVAWLRQGHTLDELGCSDAGWFVCSNPLLRPQRNLASVGAFRWGVFEYDRELTQGEQISLFQQSGLPYQILTDAAGKSIHAAVRLDAKSAQDFKFNLQREYRRFGEGIDCGVCDPTRYTRLAGGFRNKKLQGLIEIFPVPSSKQFGTKASRNTT